MELNSNKLIPWANFEVMGDELEYASDAIKSTWISGGKYVECLEKKISSLHLDHNCIAVCNGTLSLYMIFKCLNIDSGDEVIVPAFGYQAATNVLLNMGVKPVFADIKSDTWCICPESIIRKITSKTKAVVAIHSYGNACDLANIRNICNEHNLMLIEDIAESLFSTYKKKPLGTFGEMASLSMHATKTIATGEGGAVIFKDKEYSNFLNLFRSHGLERKNQHYYHQMPGLNFRLSNVLAAIGCAQLEKMAEVMTKKRKIYEHYLSELKAIPRLQFQCTENYCNPLYWAVAIKVQDICINERDKLINEMKSMGVELRPGFYPAVDLKYMNCTDYCPNSINIGHSVVVLPSHLGLTEANLEHICSQLVECIYKL